ncbi:30S ribosomal protein S17 [Candidatus Woesearchaeota archaeon]|nr:30S ribosomal protein S17 [Candidatus Woesearchaeota archaeon]
MKNNVNIGIEVSLPKQACADKHCPFHSGLKIRGRTFNGTIIKKDTHKTAVVEWPRLFYLPKYERYEKRRTRVKVHNPPCINADINDKVTIMECRPISKTKKFVIIEKNESIKS